MKRMREILNIPIIREMTRNSGKYTANTRREIEFSVCQTEHDIRVTSPSFGDSKGIRIQANKCQKEFGKNSKEIAHIHTHPPTRGNIQTLNDTRFSNGDLFTNIDDSIDEPGKSYCVAQKIKNGRKENIRVRCVDSKAMHELSNNIGYNPNEPFLMTPKNGKIFDKINKSSFFEDL